MNDIYVVHSDAIQTKQRVDYGNSADLSNKTKENRKKKKRNTKRNVSNAHTHSHIQSDRTEMHRITSKHEKPLNLSKQQKKVISSGQSGVCSL